MDRNIITRIAAFAAVTVLVISCLCGCGKNAEDPVEAPELFKKALDNTSSASFSAQVCVSDTVLADVDGAFDSSMNIMLDIRFPEREGITVYFARGEKALYWLSGGSAYRLEPDDLYDRVMAIPLIGKKYSFLDPDKIPLINGKKPGKYLVTALDAEYSQDPTEEGTVIVLKMNEDTSAGLCEFIINLIKLTDPAREVSSSQTDKLRQYVIKAIRDMKICVSVDPDETVFRSLRIDLTDSFADIAGPLEAYFPDLELPGPMSLYVTFSALSETDSAKVPAEVKSSAQDLLKYITQTLTPTKPETQTTQTMR